MKSLLDNIESRIDPFDFDVFTPYMNSNLLKHTQRCQVSSSTHVTVIVRKVFILLVCMSTLWWFDFARRFCTGRWCRWTSTVSRAFITTVAAAARRLPVSRSSTTCWRWPRAPGASSCYRLAISRVTCPPSWRPPNLGYAPRTCVN